MVAVAILVLIAAPMVLLLPVFPMVTVPGLCSAEADCVGSASLSCVMFGVGGLEWDSRYYLSAGSGCHLSEKQAGVVGVSANVTVTSDLGDD